MELGSKVTVVVFTEETWWPSSNTLSECYNNMDVGVPLWLTEPRDKSSCREFASSHPSSSSFRISYCNLCAFTFLVYYLARIGYRLPNSFWDEGFTLEES